MLRPTHTWLLLSISAALVVVAGCGGGEAGGEVSGGQKAPDFELVSLDGEPVRLADFQGKVVLIDFWATWCGPCRKQVPDLKRLYQELGPEGFEILGVAVGDREDVVRQYVQHAEIKYTTCMGTDRVVTDFGNFTSIPTAFLLDRQGNIAARYTGMQPKQSLERAIRQLLDSDV